MREGDISKASERRTWQMDGDGGRGMEMETKMKGDGMLKKKGESSGIQEETEGGVLVGEARQVEEGGGDR